MLLGLGQRTFLAGPAEISYPVAAKSQAGYAVIDGAELAKVPGQANVVVEGANAFVATGMTRDVEAWVAPFTHDQLTVDDQKKRLVGEKIEAKDSAEADGGDTAADVGDGDPRGSDLWLEERMIDQTGGNGTEKDRLRLPVALASDQSIIVASNGKEPIPGELSLVWVQDRQTPWAGPMLVAGGVLALVGGILYLLAVDYDRRGLGPRRGRRGPFQGIRNAFGGKKARSGAPSGRSGSAAGSGSSSTQGRAKHTAHAKRRAGRLAIPAVGLAVVLGLSGCSADYWPQVGPQTTTKAPEPQPTKVAPVPVTSGQITKIVKNVASVSNEADDKLDAGALKTRFTGSALAQREANYKIRKEMADYAVVPPRLTDDELDYALVQSTESWPRTIFVTVASTSGKDADKKKETASPSPSPTADAPAEDPKPEASPSLALMLTQADPHQNFVVSRVVSLRGGISMPDAAPASEGTAVLANDTATLLMPPGEVGTAYAKLLQEGDKAADADKFDLTTDTLLKNYGKARAEASQKQSDDKGQTMKFSVVAKQSDEAPVALSTGTGGALVATTVIEEQIVDSDGGRYKPQAKDAVTAISGLKGEQNKLVQEVAHQMLFYVPSKSGDGKIQLLGVTSELVGVRNK
nr:glycosyltransferase [Leucobacter edaphi]